uniref:U11/U12 small nuclear ribonucleoprotein 35 kDa protein n=1 Tax=Hirondellea gigas TaxID=1518452 RepID=A0A6A7FR21_9CRUS
MSRSSWKRIATEEYDPLKAGSIDATDTRPHDLAVYRALNARHTLPSNIKEKPRHTMFVSRLPLNVTEQQLKYKFDKVADVKSVSVIRDIVSGIGKGYAFVEFYRERDVEKILYECKGLTFEGKEALLDYEVGRSLKGWVPRRLGGGWGGRKESGQLRFGCRDRPWRNPVLTKPEMQREQNRKALKFNQTSPSSEPKKKVH